MSVTSGFFNSLSGDRKYDAIQISSMFDGLITDGIYNGFLESFMVTASSPASMVVTVGEGRCWFNHTWTLNDAPLPLTLDVGDVVLNRIDTVVIDVDSTDTVRACTIKVIKGTPSSQAVRPTLENTETHHQYPLCDISVPAGATTVTQSNITNRRGTSDCPFVATLMKSVDVDDLLIQWESQWNDWMTDRSNAMDSWTAEQQEAFTTWFQTVQDILDENTAGNLLNRINHRTGINATATYSAGVVAITAPDDAGEILTFIAPSDFLSSDTYTLNGEALTITDLNGEALDDSWKKNSPVTITVSGGKAFFKAGGSGKNDTLPPLLGNMTVEVVEGDENDTYTIKMDKLILDKTTEMVGGAQLEWGEEMPAKPGKGTGGIKTWTREEIITTGKPYDGLYLGDVTPSDAVTETLIYLPENDSGSVKLVPFIVLSTDYLGGVYVMRQKGNKDWVGKYGNNVTYENSEADIWTKSYLNSVLDKGIVEKLLECEIHVFEQGTIKRKCWIPSYGELYSDFTDSGNTFMPYFNSNGRRVLIKQDDGNLLAYWTRTFYNLSSVRIVNPDGSGSFQSASNKTAAYRPSFVLPKDFKIQQRPDGSYTVWNEQGLITLKDIKVSDSSSVTKIHVRENSGVYIFDYVSSNYNDSDRGCLFREEALAGTVGTSVTYPSGGAGQGASNWEAALPSSLRNLISEVTIKYKNATSVQETTARAFVPSIDEMYGTETNYGTGTQWSMMKVSANRIRRYNGSPISYWLRDAASSTTVNYMYTSGNYNSDGVNRQKYCVPAFTLPLTAPIRQLADGTYDLVPEDPALSEKQERVPDIPETPPEENNHVTHTVEVPHGQKVVFRQFTQNQKKQFQTMLVGGVYPPLGDVEPPFKLPEFTGNCAIFGDEVAGRIELYESGTLTLYPGVYDAFLVGGGGSGYRGAYSEYSFSTGGGGGGYTTTQKAVTVDKQTSCSVLVGASNSYSAITIGDNSYQANAGATGNQSKGGAGGSGGGAGGRENRGGAGGSDGANGTASYSTSGYKGGAGQATTTRAFGELSGTLYAGGGGGGADSGRGNGASGGAGGGGSGGSGSSTTKPGTAGTPNTGGGGGGGADYSGASTQAGAGGSGIIIVRWNNAA